MTHWYVGNDWFARRTCNTLQHTATHCISLQHTATHCNALQHTATHCNTLQRTASHCNILQHTATHCNALQHTATHCNTLQHTCNTLATHVGPDSTTWKHTSLYEDMTHSCVDMTHSYVGSDSFTCRKWVMSTYVDSDSFIRMRIVTHLYEMMPQSHEDRTHSRK